MHMPPPPSPPLQAALHREAPPAGHESWCPPPPPPPLQAALHREPHLAGVVLFKVDVSALYAVPIIVFGFNCHPNVVAVFTELARDPGRLIPRLPSR